MNTFSTGLAFSAVKLSCREMNNMGFVLAFWEAHPPHTKPISLIYFCQLRSSTSGTCSHIFPLTHLPCSIFFPRLLLPILVSVCVVWACLHGQRKGGVRACLNNTYKQYNASTQSGKPADACPPDSLLLSLLPLSTCTFCICGFSIVFLFYVRFNNCMITVLIVQGACLRFCCNQQECS